MVTGSGRGARVSTEQVQRALQEVKDPEIPVITLEELGVLRDIRYEGERLVVVLTPTFSGCPAMHVMEREVRDRLNDLGLEGAEIRMQLDPPWTTDWLTADTRQKLREFGLSPPPRHHGDLEILFSTEAECPHCGSEDTILKNAFGPTACRAIHYCQACQQPFERFKPL